MPEILDPVTQHHVDQAAARLADEFKGVFSEETIARYIGESLDLLGNSRINVFVPVLAHRFARERLRALAQVEGKMTKEAPEVLFVCVHNAGRSQMAAGLVNFAGGSRSRPLRRKRSRRRDQSGGGRGDDRDRRGHERGVPEAAHGRGGTCRGCRDHDGLRRRVPDLPRQEVRGLDARRSRRARPRDDSPHPR